MFVTVVVSVPGVGVAVGGGAFDGPASSADLIIEGVARRMLDRVSSSELDLTKP